MGNVTVNITGNPTQLVKALDKVIQKEGELQKSGDKLTRQKTSYFQDQAKGLGRMVLGYASVTAGVGMLISKVRQFHEEHNRLLKEAEEAGKSAADTMGRIVQQSLGDPDLFRRLRAGARLSFREGAFGSEQEALTFMANLDAAGLTKYRRQFSQGTGIIDAQQMAPGIDAFRTNYGVNDPMAMINMAAGVSKGAPALVQDIALAAGRLSGGAKAVGWSADELFALVALLSKSAGGIERGETLVQNLVKAVETNPSLQGLSAQGVVEKIGDMNLSPRRMQAMFGNLRERQAIRGLMQNPSAIGEFAGLARAGVEDNAFDAMVRLRDSSPGASARRRDNQLAARRYESTQLDMVQRREADRQLEIKRGLLRQHVAEQKLGRKVGLRMDSPLDAFQIATNPFFALSRLAETRAGVSAGGMIESARLWAERRITPDIDYVRQSGAEPNAIDAVNDARREELELLEEANRLRREERAGGPPTVSPRVQGE